jgi:hypothetical protein
MPSARRSLAAVAVVGLLGVGLAGTTAQANPNCWHRDHGHESLTKTTFFDYQGGSTFYVGSTLTHQHYGTSVYHPILPGAGQSNPVPWTKYCARH